MERVSPDPRNARALTRAPILSGWATCPKEKEMKFSWRKAIRAYPGSRKMAEASRAEFAVALAIYFPPLFFLFCALLPGSFAQNWLASAWAATPAWVLWSTLAIFAVVVGVPILAVALKAISRVVDGERVSTSAFWLGFGVLAAFFGFLVGVELRLSTPEEPADAAPVIAAIVLLVAYLSRYRSATKDY